MSHWNGFLFHKVLECTHSSLCHLLSFDMSVHCFLMWIRCFQPLEFTNCLSALMNKALLKLILYQRMVEVHWENRAMLSENEKKLGLFLMEKDRASGHQVTLKDKAKSHCVSMCLNTYDRIKCSNGVWRTGTTALCQRFLLRKLLGKPALIKEYG